MAWHLWGTQGQQSTYFVTLILPRHAASAGACRPLQLVAPQMTLHTICCPCPTIPLFSCPWGHCAYPTTWPELSIPFSLKSSVTPDTACQPLLRFKSSNDEVTLAAQVFESYVSGQKRKLVIIRLPRRAFACLEFLFILFLFLPQPSSDFKIIFYLVVSRRESQPITNK